MIDLLYPKHKISIAIFTHKEILRHLFRIRRISQCLCLNKELVHSINKLSSILLLSFLIVLLKLISVFSKIFCKKTLTLKISRNSLSEIFLCFSLKSLNLLKHFFCPISRLNNIYIRKFINYILIYFFHIDSSFQ